MATESHFSNQYNRGAALLAVLVVAVVMVILMGIASNLLESRLTLAQDSKQAFKDDTAVYAKRSELIYLLATQHKTIAGVSQGTQTLENMLNEEGFLGMSPIGDELRTDGYIYVEESEMSFSIQNESGLIPFNSSNQLWLKNILKNLGYSRADSARYGDSLADYADADNLRRPAGAEARSDAENTGYFPANFLLQSCNELWLVAGWHTLLDNSPELLQNCSLRREGRMNLNSMPLKLWGSIWPNSVAKIQSLRDNNQWLMMTNEVIKLEPSLLTVQDDFIGFNNGNRFIIGVKLNKSFLNTLVVIQTSKILPYKSISL
jgi:general secretion pathway protein K